MEISGILIIMCVIGTLLCRQRFQHDVFLSL